MVVLCNALHNHYTTIAMCVMPNSITHGVHCDVCNGINSNKMNSRLIDILQCWYCIPHARKHTDTRDACPCPRSEAALPKPSPTGQATSSCAASPECKNPTTLRVAILSSHVSPQLPIPPTIAQASLLSLEGALAHHRIRGIKRFSRFPSR